MENVIAKTKLYSEDGSEYIKIHTILFEYKKDKLFYGDTELDATLHSAKGNYVEFHDSEQLRNTIGIVSFYQLNQLYNFDPSVRISLYSTLLYTTKLLQDIHMLTDAMLEVYNSSVINESSNEIHCRLGNNCWITFYFIELEYDGYLIELVHNQSTLYKHEFKIFVTDYCSLINETELK
jgi:hypothetical protein